MTDEKLALGDFYEAYWVGTNAWSEYRGVGRLYRSLSGRWYNVTGLMPVTIESLKAATLEQIEAAKLGSRIRFGEYAKEYTYTRTAELIESAEDVVESATRIMV